MSTSHEKYFRLGIEMGLSGAELSAYVKESLDYERQQRIEEREARQTEHENELKARAERLRLEKEELDLAEQKRLEEAASIELQLNLENRKDSRMQL